MKNCEEIDKRIATLGGCDEYCCATLTDGSKIIFRTSDNFYARFLSSCCAITSENIFSDCESFSENFLVLHPEDIVEIDYIDFNQIEDMLETDSSFEYIEDDTYYGIEDNLIDFLRNGGTICVKGNPLVTFGDKRNFDHPTVVTTTKVADIIVVPGIEGSPVKPQQCVQANSSISGRKRKLF